MQVLNYYSVVIPNKAGEGAKLLGALKDAGVNLISFWGYPIKGKKAVLDIAPADGKVFAKTMKSCGLATSPKKVAFFIDGEDHVGAVAEILGKLAAAGINVHAVQALCAGAGRFGSLVQVAEADEKKARKVLA
jgi:hypothetical protein